MIRNVIMNVLLPAIVIFIAGNLLPWFLFTDLSAKILYGNEYDGKIALLSPKQCFIFPPLVFASLNF